jgi:hypothetical protein
VLRSRTQGPEIQQLYSLNMPVSRIRTKVREEFERHRYVNNLSAVDVLLQNSHAEFQVGKDLAQRWAVILQILITGCS